MNNVFFSSDFHGFHKNICRGTSEWDLTKDNEIHQSTRDFKSVEEMNAVILDGINSKVGVNDTLYFLGDFVFGGVDKIWLFRKEIKCKNIHFIYGNHDDHIEHNKKLPNAWIRCNSGTIVSTDDSTSDFDEQARAKDLFLSTQHVKTVKIKGVSFFLSHFAHRVWNKSHHGRIHLYGHSHNSLESKPYGLSMDVGIDAYFARFGKYEPFSFDEILDIMETRKVHIVDHHNSKTN